MPSTDAGDRSSRICCSAVGSGASTPFDLLMLDGKDQRNERLIDRQQELRRMLSRVSPTSPLNYTDHVWQGVVPAGAGRPLRCFSCRLRSGRVGRRIPDGDGSGLKS
jgi:hypothetical protein